MLNVISYAEGNVEATAICLCSECSEEYYESCEISMEITSDGVAYTASYGEEVEGALYNDDKMFAYSFDEESNTFQCAGLANSGSYTDTNYTINTRFFGYDVTSVKENAFADDTIIESVTIPESIILIETGAFAGASVTSVIFESPEGWTVRSADGGMAFGELALESEQLSDPENAATLLTDSYSGLEWIRE